MSSKTITRVVILGATGFVGSALRNSFKNSHPHIEVIALGSQQCNLLETTQVNCCASDFFTPQTVVVMCAAIKRQKGDTFDAFESNVQMVRNLTSAMRDHLPARFVFLSSTAVYGEDVNYSMIDSNTPVSPRSFYGIAKYTSECLLQKFFREYSSCSLCVVRPPTIYGPEEKEPGYGPSLFLEKAMRDEHIELWGDGTEKREFLLLADVVILLTELALDDVHGVLNMVSGKSISFIEILNAIADLLKKRIEPGSKPRSKDKVDHFFSRSEGPKYLRDYNFTDIGDGLRTFFPRGDHST